MKTLLQSWTGIAPAPLGLTEAGPNKVSKKFKKSSAVSCHARNRELMKGGLPYSKIMVWSYTCSPKG